MFTRISRSSMLLSVLAGFIGFLAVGSAGAEEPAAKTPLSLRYKFKDGQREIYVVRFETGDDSDRRVREGNVTYQFNAPSAIGFSLELILEGSSNQFLGGYQIGGRQIIGNTRVKSGPIKFNDLGIASDASDANRTRPIPGDIQGFVIIPLSEKSERKWTRENSLNFTFTTRSGQSRTSAATETDTYVFQKQVDKSIALERTLTVATKDAVGGKPMWELSMKGTVVLDAVTGLPLEGEWAGTITQRDERAEIRTPFRESFRRLSEDAKKVIEAEAAKKKEQSDKFKADIARLDAYEKTPPSLRKPITKPALDKAIKDLNSKDVKLQEAAIDTLLSTRPDPARRTEVLAALKQVRHSDSNFVSFGVRRVEDEWEDAVSTTPAAGAKGKNDKAGGKLSKEQETQMLGLIQELSSKRPQQRQLAATALADFVDQRAVDALASAMGSDVFVRKEAVSSLKAMGPMAADAVVKHLEGQDVFLVRSALEVMKVQGTKKHVPAVQKLVDGEQNSIVRDQYREVIAAMQARN